MPRSCEIAAPLVELGDVAVSRDDRVALVGTVRGDVEVADQAVRQRGRLPTGFLLWLP